jgi:hypothetical protein
MPQLGRKMRQLVHETKRNVLVLKQSGPLPNMRPGKAVSLGRGMFHRHIHLSDGRNVVYTWTLAKRANKRIRSSLIIIAEQSAQVERLVAIALNS